MVNEISIYIMFGVLLTVFMVPLALGVYFYKTAKISLKALFTGCLVFFVFQLVLRVPLLQVLSSQSWYIKLSDNTILIGLFLALTAGLFEETGRLVGFKLLLSDRLQWKNGLAFGIGHGGIESIVIVGFSYLNNITLSYMINSGMFNDSIEGITPEVAAEIKEKLINTPPDMYAAAGIERFFTIIIQIALSILVLYSIKNRKYIYFILAILLHIVIDAPIAIFNEIGLNIWVIESYILIFAVISLVFIMKSKTLMMDKNDLSSIP